MHKAIGWSVVSFALLGGTLLAQQVRPGAQPVQPGIQPGVRQVQPGQPGAQNQQQNQLADHQIAALIMTCNRNEVETAKFAMNKLQSDEAKEIATQMIKDHTEGMNKFAKWAGQAAPVNTGGREGQGDREERPREGNREQGRRENDRTEAEPTKSVQAGANAGNTAPGGARVNNAAGGTGGVANPNSGNALGNTTAQGAGAGQPNTTTAFRPAMGGLNWAAVHQEIADEALAGCKKELARYEGNEFDKAYLGHQLAAHLKADTELKVLKRHASSQLGAEIDEAIQMTEGHIKHLRKAMDDKKDEKSDSKK